MAKILLIEPNTVLAKVYQEALGQNGHEVMHASGAQTAIDAADARQPDLVILELQLPRHNGIEFLHEFRSYHEWWKVPVIVNTVIAPEGMAEFRKPLELDLDVRAILYKPQCSLQTLLRVVGEQLA